jgi:biopolymer transport protein ExbD
MKMSSPTPRKRARIEIIPLIDIMFFLLASFMLASLSLIRLRSLEMALPTATTPARTKADLINVAVSPDGDLYVGDSNYNVVDLERFLVSRYKANSNVQVYIKANAAATYGMFIHALDLVKESGIPKVSCAISPPPGASHG